MSSQMWEYLFLLLGIVKLPFFNSGLNPAKQAGKEMK